MTRAPSQLPSHSPMAARRRSDRRNSRPAQAPAAARRMVAVSIKRQPQKASAPASRADGGLRRAKSSSSTRRITMGSR